MSITAIEDCFRTAYWSCKVQGHVVPKAEAMQKLVAAWKQMRVWGKR